jgi:hypothetical protein
MAITEGSNGTGGSTKNAIIPSSGYVLDCNGASGNVKLEHAMAQNIIKMFEIFKKKQASYGCGNISEFGEKGVIIRMNDKMKRLIKLVWNGEPNPLADENIEDTYFDMADYALIALLVKAGKWG